MTKINLIGKNVMGYTICEELGSGAFGTVYKVIKTNEAGRFVRALKHIAIPTEKQYQFVLNSMGGDVSKTNNYFSQIPQNILSEIKILNALSEKEVPHIIRYYEHDIQISNSPRRYDIFILMQYVIPLENFIQRYKFFVRDVVKLGFDILNGLHFCHSNGIMHRDIKSDNIFVSDNGEYKIGDFGLSKILEDSSKAESLKGTLDFIAPEVYLNGESYTKSVDLYSLGIVLYRLLNYNRNPFLPYFPEQFYIQDEEAAFEKRISGKTPEYPLLGGEHIGGVIVKAISNKTERFQTADEFLSALKTAASDTSADILDEKVNFNIDSSLESFYNFGVKTHEKILSKVVPSSMTQQEDMDDRQRNLVDEHFFESIEGMTDEKISEQESIVNHNQKMSIRDIAPSINKFVFLISFIIFMIGVVVYFIVVPNIYGKVVWMLDWLFMDAQNIIDILYDSNTISPQVNSIIAMRIFWWVWWIAFTVSIFFVGKRLQTKPEPSAVNALLIKKESFLLIQDVNVVLREVKQHRNSEHLNSLICAVKRLEEKISVESDFGYGDYTIIDCENKIVKQLQFLLESASHIETGDFNENINNLNIIVINIHSLLRKRTELKKR